jgi:hypothetical protein
MAEEGHYLWIGHRDRPDEILRKDPSLFHPEALPYAALPGGHEEAWPDAFRNNMRNIFTRIAKGEGGADYPTFANGVRVLRIVDAMLTSARNGGAWTEVK